MIDTRDLIVIEPDGRVAVGDDLRSRLSDHAGAYRLLPTSDHLVLLQRVNDPRGDERLRRAMLTGEIAHLGGLTDILQLICNSAWSGELEVMSGQTRKALYWYRGDIQSAASNVAEDRLGAIFYRFGLVSEDALDRALARAQTRSHRIGRVLVEDGVISEAELHTSMRRQVEEIFYSVLNIRDGEFYFYSSIEDTEVERPAQLLSTKGLLFEGIRRIDELAHFRERLPTPTMVLTRCDPAPTGTLSALEETVLQLVDGLRTIDHVARASQLGEFEATRILFELLQAGRVQPRTQPLPDHATADDVHTRILLVFNEVYAKIYAAVARELRDEVLARGLESFFVSVAEFSPLFASVKLNADGTLPVEQVLFNLALAPTDDKLDYLHRALNEMLFFELFTAGEAVDRREEIELHQRLSQILNEVPGTLT